ncbi:aldo/keto reductase [Polyangium aurulentum]|uniref:aldo/keto reductase n=1 Tax=Polyangium aurulentum TaxID=2567896 RepID=UPI0010AE6745|nr:aldo/keto reductase [Polyangium aurulentum]UQA56794.1 aldo/keto reductase [Polyangium aurulentum]
MSSLLETWTRPRAPSDRPLIALGAMNFGKRTPEPEALRILDRALERGVTLVDTANAYTDGVSESIVGKALAGRRDKALLATKVGVGRIGGPVEGLSRTRVLAAIDESLARLGTDYVDIYYLHVPDHATPLEETLDAISELLASGKIRAWAVSNYASWQILEMLHIAERRGMPRPVMSQVLYNVLIRQLDIEYFRFTRTRALHSTIYNPLAGGLLAGKHARSPAPTKGSRFDKNPLYQKRYWSDRFFDLVEAYGGVAESEGMTLVELAYGWLAGTPGVDSILVGPGSIEHLDAALDACARVVSPEGRRKIDAIHKDFQGTDASYAR